MDNAAWVADATEMIYINKIEDRSGFDNAGLQPESWSLFKAARGHGLRGHYRPDRLEQEPGLLPLIQTGKSGVPAVMRYSCPRLYRRRLVRKLILHVQVL